MRPVCSDDKAAAPMALIVEQFVPQLVVCAVLRIGHDTKVPLADPFNPSALLKPHFVSFFYRRRAAAKSAIDTSASTAQHREQESGYDLSL